MTFTGSPQDINSALNGLLFQPGLDYKGLVTLQIITDDLGNSGKGGALNTLDSVNISVVERLSLDELITELTEPTSADPTPTVSSPPAVNDLPSNAEANTERETAEEADTENSSEEPVSKQPDSESDAITELVASIPTPIYEGLVGERLVDDRSLLFFDLDHLSGDDNNDSVTGLVRNAVLKALPDPLLAAKMLIPLQPQAPLWDILDKMMAQMDDSDESDSMEEEIFERSATGLTFTLTTGYVSWLLRAGYLSASLMSVLPLWREFDPLPILAKPKEKKGKSDKKDKDFQDSDEKVVEEMFDPFTGPDTRNGNSEADS
jgi:hypothetical protein